MPISRGERIFGVVNGTFLILVALLCLAPMVHVLGISLSDNSDVATGRVTFLPRQFTVATYRRILNDGGFWRAAWTSSQRTGLAVVLTLTLTVLSAYPLSKTSEEFAGRKLFAWIFFLTLIISGGMVPSYVLISSLGLIGNIWALVLPTSANALYVVIALNFFRRLPNDVAEAARIDGASEWTVLTRVTLPASAPLLAILAVFCSLDHWNEWFTGIIYMRFPYQYPLMSYLQGFRLQSQTGQAAQLVLAAIPMLCLYPFLQRHFVKGLVLRDQGPVLANRS